MAENRDLNQAEGMTPTLAFSLAATLLAAIAIAWAIHAVNRAMRRRRRVNWRSDMLRGGKTLGAFRTMMSIEPAGDQAARPAGEDRGR